MLPFNNYNFLSENILYILINIGCQNLIEALNERMDALQKRKMEMIKGVILGSEQNLEIGF